MRKDFKTGGRVGFSRAGPVGNLPWVRGTSRPGVKKAPRGAQHKEAIKQETADRIKKFEHAGPREQTVITKRILGKKTKKGDRTKAAVEDAMATKQSPWSNIPGSKKPYKKGGKV